MSRAENEGGCDAGTGHCGTVDGTRRCFRLRRGRACHPGQRRAAPVRRPPHAVAGVERRGRARHRASLRTHQNRRAVGRVAVLRAIRARDQRHQERAQRRDPGAQLPDAGDLPLRRRCGRQLASARPRGHEGQRRHHRAGRRALHGRDGEDIEPGQNRADPGHARRLLARLVDHRRGRAAAPRALPRRAGGHLCQHLRRGEGRERHHLHVVERAAGRRKPWRRQGDLRAGPISGEIRRFADEGEDHRLEGLVRGA